jgi:hypothetical protein
MSSLHFRWCRYVVRDPKAPGKFIRKGYKLHDNDKLIVAVEHEEPPYLQAEAYDVPDDLFLIFVQSGSNSAAILAFCNEWGLLIGASRFPVPTGYNCASQAKVADIQAARRALRLAYEGVEKGDPTRLFDHLNGITGPGVQLHLTGGDPLPASLIHAMWRQLLQHQAKGVLHL